MHHLTPPGVLLNKQLGRCASAGTSPPQRLGRQSFCAGLLSLDLHAGQRLWRPPAQEGGLTGPLGAALSPDTQPSNRYEDQRS
jgi:hypothetical protein